MKKILTTLLLLLVGTPAGADELVKLRAEIADARTQKPEAFAAVEQLRAKLVKSPPTWEHRAQVSRTFKALGPAALYPLLAVVAPDSAAVRNLAPTTRTIFLVSAIEALAAMKDRRALAAYHQIVDGLETEPLIVRAATQAIGALDTEEDASYLIARAQPGQPRELAAIAGLGYCRRTSAATHLSARLDAHPAATETAAIAEAMGWLGSSWAWTALGPQRAAEGAQLRDRLAASLVAAYPNYSGQERQAIGEALLLVEHPATPNRLAQLRAHADVPLAADLLSLERRFTLAGNR